MVLDQFKGLPSAVKGGIIVVLLGVSVTVGLTVYSRYTLHKAHQKELLADRERQEAMAVREQAQKLNEAGAKLQAKLDKANARVADLEAEVAKIKIPEKPVNPPETVKATLDDLQKMGLTLVQKPSLQVKPSIAGITQEDAVKVWFWGKEAARVEPLEAKLYREGELIAGLQKAKDLAESLAATKTKEADALGRVADLHMKEADNLRAVVEDQRKAMTAEQKKKYLYAAGSALVTYLVVKH